ncbi:small-conductance mechanosensitive ion channel [Syntrophotalea carbinolica DSM 2380]|uniref:Small-conductance mechanosensitive ion channel n=1 Tax=Syntrophotalea carbinolica (strain DSM 2380 / NBRC 103641 / GraBd1) TaxID=338963 RepID=Q3A106_SYNC1|nr:mechanosensitive ion channel family protein [Syntrophotalea carbinolica]ABA89951.1 small-conductance mechanosensitive ion channel [Syntrophotalea carbinolica DSM 2380]
MNDLQLPELPQFIEQYLSRERLLWILLVIILTAAGLWLTRRLLQSLANRFSRHRLLISGLYPVLRLLAWIGALAYILFVIIHPPLNTLLAISASAGLAIGLGAQDLVRNILAGILILFERPFHVGDMIEVGEHYGEVVNIGLRAVQIRTFEDSIVTFPNSLVQTGAVSNANAGQLNEMVVVHFHLPSSVPIAPVRQIAWEAAACSPYVQLDKPITVLVEDHFDFTFLTRFTIKAYVHEIRLERVLASDISERIKTALQERGWVTDPRAEG